MSERSFDTLHNPPGKAINPLTAYQRAMLSQLQPAMLALALLPALAFAVLWAMAFWASWATWMNGFQAMLAWLPWAGQWFQSPNWFTSALVGVLVFLIYVLLVLVSALTFVSTLGMPLMLRHVARDYPEVERLRGGTIMGSISNALWGVFWFLLQALITLPLWFIPLVGWLIPLILFGLLNARVLRYDALSEHASAEEMQALARAPRLYWRVLGMGGALINLVPFAWLFSTTITGLAFIHYALAALSAQRNPTTQKAVS